MVIQLYGPMNRADGLGTTIRRPVSKITMADL